MSKLRLSLAQLSLFLCFVLLPAQSVWAQSEGAIVRPEPVLLEIGEGQVETVQIVLENAQAVYGIDVQASFDPAVVEVVDADPARDGVQLIPGDFVKPDFAVRNGADNEAGTLQYVITQVNPTEPASGSGTVFSIQFRGKVLGAQAELKIDSVQIADRRGVKLSVQPQNGTLTVVPPKPETPTPVSPTEPAESAATDTPVAEIAGVGAAEATDTPGAATPTAAAEPAATAVPAASTGALSGDSLMLITVGALVGTIIVLVLAFFVLRRRPTNAPGSETRR